MSQSVADDGSTFVCCGIGGLASRSVVGDCFRHCFKTENTDTMFDYDELDLLDTIRVMSESLAIRKRIEEGESL